MGFELRRYQKIAIIIFAVLYSIFITSTRISNTIEAVMVLIASFLLLHKARFNVPMFIMFTFIFYINYSIVVGEYIIAGNLSVPMQTVKSIFYYGKTIRIMFVFILTFLLFLKENRININDIKIVSKDRPSNYWAYIGLIFIVFIFGVSRSETSTYIVRITPFFEYSKLLVLFAFFNSGKSVFKKSLLAFCVFAIVIQDVLLGGRITSLQLIILFSLLYLIKIITIKRIVILSFIGILFNAVIGIYRHSFSFKNVDILEIFSSMFSNFFVFDTATYAYYASVTHVASTEFVNLDTRLIAAYQFFLSIFGLTDSLISNLTLYVSRYYFTNVGGGLIPTFFYFWFGWLGVIGIGLFLACLINRLNESKSYHNHIFLIAIIINVPRWYLYSPNQLFRGSLFVISVLIFLDITMDRISRKFKIFGLDDENSHNGLN